MKNDKKYLPINNGWKWKKSFFRLLFSYYWWFDTKKQCFFWWFWKCSKFSVPVAIGTLHFILTEKKCQDSPHVMSKIHEFLEYDFKIFSRFSKKVEKKGFFWLLPHIEKLKKNTKKWRFFWKIIKVTFQLTMGGSWKKTHNKFISFTIVNTKTVVHTTVNTYYFSMILPLIMLCLRIVPFFVRFTI